jgi:hypothetical protein
MQLIFSYFWSICLLRGHPADFPSNRIVLGSVLAVYCCSVVFAATLTYPQRTFASVLGITLTALIIQTALVWSLSWFKNVPQRFPPIWGSTLGAGIIMTWLLLPIHTILLGSDSKALLLFADSATWIWLGWWLAIVGNILSKGVKISVLQGAIIAFVIELLSVIATFMLFPGTD